jgi:hypothetical protein
VPTNLTGSIRFDALVHILAAEIAFERLHQAIHFDPPRPKSGGINFAADEINAMSEALVLSSRVWESVQSLLVSAGIVERAVFSGPWKARRLRPYFQGLALPTLTALHTRRPRDAMVHVEGRIERWAENILRRNPEGDVIGWRYGGGDPPPDVYRFLDTRDHDHLKLSVGKEASIDLSQLAAELRLLKAALLPITGVAVQAVPPATRGVKRPALP